MSTFVDQVNRTPVTYLVLLAYGTMAILSHGLQPSRAEMIRYGAEVGYLVQDGEIWRLLSYAFLHGGALHLLLNSLFLYIVGPQLEMRLGSPRFALLYAVAALGGGIIGSIWSHPLTTLVGGSGALFGMLGGAVALQMRQGRHLLDFLSYQGGRLLLSLIAINLLIGFMVPIISNSGHLGGLTAGFVLVFCFFERGRAPVDRVGRAIQGGWLALGASLLFYCVFPVLRSDYNLKVGLRAASFEAQRDLVAILRVRDLPEDFRQRLRRWRDGR